MKPTTIEWTDLSSNPLKYRDGQGRVVWGCVKKSAGCANCYSEAIAHHYDRGGPFTRATMEGLTPFLDEKDLKQILTARTAGGKKVAGSRCFLGDMTDVFGEWVPDELLDRLFAVLALRPDVTFQLLTKRADRMRVYFDDDYTSERIACQITQFDPTAWGERRAGLFDTGRDEDGKVTGVAVELPLPNVWLGVSCENQAAADERIPHLLDTPAAVRFLSCEPLLGTVSLTDQPWWDHRSEHAFFKAAFPNARPPIDWVIVGGESGPGSRPMQIEWARSLVAQCKAAKVPVFVKQLGAICTASYYDQDLRAEFDGERGIDWPDPVGWNLRDGQPPLNARIELPLASKKGGQMKEWPSDLRVREFPVV